MSHTAETSMLEGGLDAYRGDSVIACSIVFILLCTTCLSLRFVSHHIGCRPLTLEDWLMVPAWFLMMGLCANLICSVKLGGVGRHQDYVLKFQPEAMESWALTLFTTELIYGIIMALEKTAILLLYLRLFQIQRWFRVTTQVLIAFVWLWGISESLVAIFQCKPVAFQWNKKLRGTCIDQLAYYRWVRVPNVIHDLVMLGLPLPVVFKLRIALRQKIALASVFILGSIGCVASFISMALFFRLDAFGDNTWASIQLMSWTLAEPGVIFVCACMPALWPLVVLLMPRITTTHSKSGNMTSHYGHIEASHHGGDGIGFGSDDSVPLNNFENVAAGTERATPPGTADLEACGTGINVTKEFSWKESPRV